MLAAEQRALQERSGGLNDLLGGLVKVGMDVLKTLGQAFVAKKFGATGAIVDGALGGATKR